MSDLFVAQSIYKILRLRERLKGGFDETHARNERLAGENGELLALIERQAVRIAELEQFKAWAEPQIADRASLLGKLERLEAAGSPRPAKPTL